MNGTIKYYDENASYYFDSTSQVDLVPLYKEFLEYVPAEGRIMDLGNNLQHDVIGQSRHLRPRLDVGAWD